MNRQVAEGEAVAIVRRATQERESRLAAGSVAINSR
jgi:hypothetical protein